ncbi:MAG: RnfH family protein [Solimonas sp.]
MAAPELRIEVVCALPGRQRLKALAVSEGTTVAEAVAASGLLAEFPEIDPARAALGVFGRVVDATRPVCDGERVEIYRPLQVDPKAARRERARRSRQR